MIAGGAAIAKAVVFSGILFAGTLFGDLQAQATFATEGLSCTLSNAARGALASCDGSLSDDGPAIKITLEGRAPNSVTRVSLSRGRDPKPFQQINVRAQPVIDPETIGILFIDLDFDGYRDLAVMAFLPAGPNVPYLYFLYKPNQQKFVRSRQLDKITSPEVLKSRKLLRSNWRSSADEAGEDLWAWHNGHAFLVERIKKRWTSHGDCSATFYKFRNGRLRQYKRRKCGK